MAVPPIAEAASFCPALPLGAVPTSPLYALLADGAELPFSPALQTATLLVAAQNDERILDL